MVLDDDIDEVESELLDDDYTDDRKRARAEHARRRLQDQTWLDEMHDVGFTGLEFEVFWEGLAAYGIAVIMAWTRSGQIAARCSTIGRPVHIEHSLEHWTRDDRQEIALETVARALDFFMTKVLLPRRWHYRGGASLRTFFVGACLLQFPNAYTLWATEHKRWHGRHDNAGYLQDDTEEPARPGAAWSDPTSDTVINQQVPPELLDHITDSQTRAALHLVSNGYTYAQAGAAVGLSERAVEGRLYRLKAALQPPADHPGRPS